MLSRAADSDVVHSEFASHLLPAIAHDCGHPFYFRLQPTLSSGLTMVTTSPEQLRLLQRDADDFVARNATELDRIAVYLLLAAKHPAYLASHAGAASAERLCGPRADPLESS